MHIGPFALVSLLVAEGAGAAVEVDVEGVTRGRFSVCPVPSSALPPRDLLAAVSSWHDTPLLLQVDAYVDAVMTMSVMVGVIYLSLWALQLGFIVELLSDPW